MRFAGMGSRMWFDAAMRNLLVVTVVVSAALASVGCKKKAASDADAAYAKLSAFKDQMCACTDKSCVEKVQDDMMKWGDEQAKKMGDKKPAMSDADQKKFGDATMKLNECAQKAMGMGSDMMNPPK